MKVFPGICVTRLMRHSCIHLHQIMVKIAKSCNLRFQNIRTEADLNGKGGFIYAIASYYA